MGKRDEHEEEGDSDVEFLYSTSGTFTLCERSRRRCTDKKLNSSTFERCLDHMWSNFSENTRASFARFESLWFSLYLKAPCKEKVLTWIKKKQIFSKKYVLVPIVCSGHWNLLIFCHLGEDPQSKTRTPCMLLLDSLQMKGLAEPGRLESDIRKLVSDIYKAEDRPETEELVYQFPLLVPKVPQQINGEDCGRFVLYFISLFVENAPQNFSTSEGYPYFMKENWFTHESFERFWKQLAFLEK